MDATLAISLPKVACKFGHLLILQYFFDEKTEEPFQKRQLVQTAPTLPSKSPLSLSQIRTGVRYAFVCLFGGEPSTSKLMPAMEWVYPSLEWHCKNVQPQWALASQEYDCKAFSTFFAGEPSPLGLKCIVPWVGQKVPPLSLRLS